MVPRIEAGVCYEMKSRSVGAGNPCLGLGLGLANPNLTLTLTLTLTLALTLTLTRSVETGAPSREVLV